MYVQIFFTPYSPDLSGMADRFVTTEDMTMETHRYRDYFSFESIRDQNGTVVCYHITMIGTIERDGVARIRSDFGTEQDKKMAFGRLTVRGCDRKIAVLLKETGSRVYYHSYTEEDGPYDIISFAAKDWRADEVYKFTEGDRVLIEGRAYLRAPSANAADPRSEMTVTVSGHFLLGRRKRAAAALLPQQDLY